MKGYLLNLGVAALMALTLTACGGGSSSSDTTDTTPEPTTEPTAAPTETPGGLFDTSGAVTQTCETEGGHSSYKGQDCTRSGCHATSKTMSYAGSATVGTTIYIKENNSGMVWALPTNSQGNFCLRSKYGGDRSGGYRAQTTAPMVAQPTAAGCASGGAACHDSGRPIF